MKKSMLILVSLISTIFLLVSVASADDKGLDAIKPMEVKLTSITPIGHPIYGGLEMFKALVEANTQGKIKVALFPASQLGDQPTQFDMVRAGSVEIGHIGGGILANIVKEWNIGGTMYLFRGYDHFIKVWGGPIGKDLSAKMIPHGIKVLNPLGLVGVRHVLSKKPVRSIDDMQGLPMRAPPAPMYSEGFKAVGASPTTIAFGEVYTALQLGTVDAMECPLDWIYKMRFHEVAKYLTLTGHIRGDAYTYLANKKWWDTLPLIAQNIINEAAMVASLHANTNIKQAEAEIRKKMEAEGVTFIDIDAAPFQERVGAVIPKLAKLWGGDMGLYEKVKNTQ